MAVLRFKPLTQVLGGSPVAVVLEHSREQLLGGLLRLQVELVVVLGRQHQPRLELEQRRYQDEELGGRLQIELAAALQVLNVGEHDVREVDLEQVDLFPEDQRQEQVEGTVEDLEIEVERGD